MGDNAITQDSKAGLVSPFLDLWLQLTYAFE